MNLIIRNSGSEKHPHFILKNGSETFCTTDNRGNAILIVNAMSKINPDELGQCSKLDSINVILQKINELKGIDLTSNISQDFDILMLRYVYCKLAKDTGETYKNIGIPINRNHSSVRNLVTKFSDLYSTDSNFRRLYNEIKNYEI